jgi:hypothetical protein
MFMVLLKRKSGNPKKCLPYRVSTVIDTRISTMPGEVDDLGLDVG